MTARVRERILREHDELRARLDEIDAFLGANDDSAMARLRELGLALYRRLREHIDLENRILAPALRAGGHGGADRAEELELEHAEQRELLTFLIGRLGGRRPAVLTVRELRSFVDCLREDMAREEAMLGSGPPLPATGDPAGREPRSD